MFVMLCYVTSCGLLIAAFTLSVTEGGDPGKHRLLHLPLLENAFHHRCEIDHCTAFRPCSSHGITPSSMSVCGELKSRGESARELISVSSYQLEIDHCTASGPCSTRHMRFII